MRRAAGVFLFVSAATVFAALCLSVPALATLQLYDEKLEIKGFVKNTTYVRTGLKEREKQYRDSAVDYSQTSLLVKALYRLRDDGDLAVRLFAGVRAWYEASGCLDDSLRRHMAHRDRKDYTGPRSIEEDMITEAYIDIIRGPWELRAGKQIVIWGQLDTRRVADVVNPLDLRWGAPGVDTWEEVKKGLWMLRFFYQTLLPGDLLLEGIFNPGHFQETRLPYEGTHWGVAYHRSNTLSPGRGFGAFHWQQEKMHRDAPGWDLGKNYEFGFRVRGYVWDIDWTLLYWNALSDSPVANSRRMDGFIGQYMLAGLRSCIQGGGVRPGDWPDYKLYYYKRYQTLGGTAQTCISRLHASVWRLEWFYEKDSPFNVGSHGSASAVNGWTRRDVIGFGLQYNDKFEIPLVTQGSLCAGKQLELAVTYFWEKILNNTRELVKADRGHRPGDSVTDAVIVWLRQDFLHSKWSLVFVGNYYFRTGQWQAVSWLTYYFPGIHWRCDAGYKAFGEKHGYVYGAQHDKDSIILRLRYEF